MRLKISERICCPHLALRAALSQTIAVQNSGIPLELSFFLWEKVARRAG